MANGSLHSMYFVKEADGYGITPTEASTNWKWLRHNSTTLGLEKSSLQSEELRSDRQIADFRLGTSQVNGDVVSELSYSSLDDFLEAALCGTWATNVLKAGTVRRSFSILRFFEDLPDTEKRYQIYTGNEVTTLSLAMSPESIITATFSMIGKGVSSSLTAPTGTLGVSPSTRPMDSFTGQVLIGPSGSETPNAVVTEINLTLENGIEPRYVVGSRETIQPSIARSNLTGSMTCFFENTEILDGFWDELDMGLSIQATDGQTGGAKYTFFLPRFRTTSGKPDVTGEGPITLSVNFQAVMDPILGSQLQITRSSI